MSSCRGAASVARLTDRRRFPHAYRKRISNLLLAALPVFVLSACTGGLPSSLERSLSPTETRSIDLGASGEPAESVQPNGVPRRTDLGKGTTRNRYAIEALDPTTHTYTVDLVASDSPDLEVWLTTGTGARLKVTSSTLDDLDSCDGAENRTVCEWRFPALEAQRPGTWQMHLLKRTPATVVVTISVSFEPVGLNTGIGRLATRHQAGLLVAETLRHV